MTAYAQDLVAPGISSHMVGQSVRFGLPARLAAIQCPLPNRILAGGDSDSPQRRLSDVILGLAPRICPNIPEITSLESCAAADPRVEPEDDEKG